MQAPVRGSMGSPWGQQRIRQKPDAHSGAPQTLAEIPHTRVPTAGWTQSNDVQSQAVGCAWLLDGDSELQV